MIRSKKKSFKVDLILSGDWHIRETQPICRIDDFWEEQWKKVQQIINLSNKYNCKVLLGGDFFEHWKTSPYLLNKCLETIPKELIKTIIGNHDQPSHNMDLMNKSGLQTLFETKTVQHIPNQGDWGFIKKNIHPFIIKNKKIVVLHIMTYKGKSPWPGCTDPECNELFNWFPKADLILTNHNHKSFIAKKGERLLINPGSLTRHKADQVNHKPCVFLWCAKTNTCKKHYLKIKDNVMSTEYLKVKKAKDKRINAFIEKLKTKWDGGLSFEQNIEIGLQKNKISKKVKNTVLDWIGN